jgi:hypothetical protein
MKRGGPLFTFSEFPPGAPRDSNAMLMAVSEDVSAGPGIVRGADYFSTRAGCWPSRPCRRR